MFGKAYVVNTICGGQQVYESGILDSEDHARTMYDQEMHIIGTSIDYRTGLKYTTRLICNGEVLAEATQVNGEVLATI